MVSEATNYRELFRITVYYDLALTGENNLGFLHHGIVAKLKKAAILASQKGWQVARSPVTKPEDWPVTLDILVRRGRKLDSVNIFGCCKNLIDGIFAKQRDRRTGMTVPGLVTPDDSERYVIAGRVWQETGICWKGREEVVFIVKTGDASLCNSESGAQTLRAD